MDFGSLRALALDLNFNAHGVPATVTRPAPEHAPISTRVVWVTPATEPMPGGSEFQRSEAIRIAALRRDEVPTVPTGTVIVAPPKAGDANKTWIVEGIDRDDADKVHAKVIEDT